MLATRQLRDPISKLVVRAASSSYEAYEAIAFRSQTFGRMASPPAHSDGDQFDGEFEHILIQDSQTGDLVGVVRVRSYRNPCEILSGYTGSFYDLTPLTVHHSSLMEMGRLCVPQKKMVPAVVRLLWAYLISLSQITNASAIFGCTSFLGNNPYLHQGALRYLARTSVGPSERVPIVKATNVVKFDELLESKCHDTASLAQVPHLMRSYLAMGAWVSDHAVVDDFLDTVHVFTAIELENIPANRMRVMRNLLSEC
ncbi:GNAT family N-acetyltransferase [Pelagovum sp. HNIBRBA483]|uniref:GNAT family N-acetyltransferase n=1 Tax=Pelagovum sp. HNIBRBA483 TaxID=3233341 RepID=UPI0034A3CEE5